MALDPACVGAPWDPLSVTCDTRWLMSYAAGIGAADPRYLDAGRDGGPVAHPVFPVAPEWALITAGWLPSTMTAAEAARGVHAAHDLTIHRSVRAGEVITMQPVVAGVVASRAGARVTVDIAATDEDGAPVWSTRMTNVHLGVEVSGDDVPPPPLPSRLVAGGQDADVVVVDVPATAAHVYTECARIWNPIHTDVRAARAAGLAGIVLHGTATLAMAVQVVLDRIGAAPQDVTALCGTFRAPVPLPSRLAVSLTGAASQGSSAQAGLRTIGVTVGVLPPGGEVPDDGAAAGMPLAIRDGAVVLRRPP